MIDRFSTDSHGMVRDTVRRFAEDVVLPAAAAIDVDDVFPREIYRRLADQGLFDAGVPKTADGSGFDCVILAIAMEELARCSGSMGNACALPLEIARFLLDHGDAHHMDLVAGIVSGAVIPATAVSEPDHGSDVAGMRTTAVRDGADYVINGTKAWVTMGLVADLVLVFAKTDPEAGHRGISCFLVESRNRGLKPGSKEKLLGMRGLETGALVFDDCRVPARDRIGPENQAFRMAMTNFDFGRILMAAMALGIACAAYEDALAYAKERVQFGKPIFEHQSVQFMLADMSTDLAAARLLIHHAARTLDAGTPVAKEAAHAKLFTTDMAMKHVTNALQIHGGNGYSSAYRVERLFRDIKLTQIYEGTNQIQRLIIARQIAKEA